MSSPEFLSQARPAEVLREAILRHVRYTLVRPTSELKPADYLKPVSLAIRDRIVDRMLETESRYRHKDSKKLYYLSMEFLMGRSLGDNLSNLRVEELCREVLAGFGVSLDEVLDSESDAGLGNGGLGRLAACFLESLATLAMPGFGYGIDYEYGLFKQEIFNGFQREKPDRWKADGTPFQIEHPEEAVNIPLYGRVEGGGLEAEDALKQPWLNPKIVVGIPADMPIVGYLGQTVNWLRLFTARASEDFDIEIFNRGDYIRAVEQKIASENISRVLYPSDSVMSGKELRLVQEYFLVACAIGDLMRRFRQQHKNIETLPSKVAIQMNDTHPAIAVAELMRLLIDEHGLEWDAAWHVTQHTLAYTNHTLLPEALEQWPRGLFGFLLPRPLEIIDEINRRHLENVRQKFPGDVERAQRLSLIDESGEKHVRMAHLAALGSHAINGVAALHTELLKSHVLRDFYELTPEKFSNKTNGVTPRRWMVLANPGLARLLTERIGTGWEQDLEKLRRLEPMAEDAELQKEWRSIKFHNKATLSNYIQQHIGIATDPESMFDVLVKRLHEYKRQHLQVLHILTLLKRIQRNPDVEIVPRTFLFGGKAAPGYRAAKLIIKLIHSVGEAVNAEPLVRGRLKVVFLPDYSVKLGQRVYPAADLSEQISLAGKEASGTGNMKFAMNGALTIGTLDGANIEIREEVGAENFFLFGLTTPEVEQCKRQGYNPRVFYESNADLREVLDALSSGEFSHGDKSLFEPLVRGLLEGDEYMLLADYQAYIDCQDRVSLAYRDQAEWTRMSILNVARIGKFSSDRSIRDYCADIWKTWPVKIQI